MYPVNQLLRVPQDSESLAAAELLHAPSDTRTTLKTVAAANTNGDKVAVKCNCKKDCSSGRCKCIKNAVGCSVYCHGNDDRDCGNLCSLQTRTQLALVGRPTRTAAARASASGSTRATPTVGAAAAGLEAGLEAGAGAAWGSVGRPRGLGVGILGRAIGHKRTSSAVGGQAGGRKRKVRGGRRVVE